MLLVIEQYTRHPLFQKDPMRLIQLVKDAMKTGKYAGQAKYVNPALNFLDEMVRNGVFVPN